MNNLNLRQLQYAVLLSQEGSFSALAQKLNITQPALSKQILTLEKTLGIQLFDRNSNPLTLTAAGEHFIKEAKELLFREDKLMRSMEQFRQGEKGRLVIGITPFRSAYLIPKIVKKVRERFPGVQVRLVEQGSELLRKNAAEGKFDLAVVNMPVDESALDVTLIEPDRLVLVLRREMAEKIPALQGKEKIDFSLCKDLPFVVPGEGQEMRMLFEKLCDVANIHPEIAVEAVSLNTVWELACSGVGATLLPLQFVNSEIRGDKLVVMEIENNVYLRQPAVVIKRGQYVSAYARYALELLRK